MRKYFIALLLIFALSVSLTATAQDQTVEASPDPIAYLYEGLQYHDQALQYHEQLINYLGGGLDYVYTRQSGIIVEMNQYVAEMGPIIERLETENRWLKRGLVILTAAVATYVIIDLIDEEDE